MKRVLITGGAGYIGYSLVETLQQQFQGSIERIEVYDNLSRKNYAFFLSQQFKGISMKFTEGELLDERSLKRSIDNADVVVHLAAKVTTPNADHEAHFFDQINHWGTSIVCNLLEASQVKHFIYLSSAAVYGRTDEAADESAEPNPYSFYAKSKWDAEKHVNRLSDKMKVHVLRSANVYGFNPALRIDAVINKFMFNAHFNNLISINGDGMQQRAFIHVDKLSKVISELINGKLDAGLYNVAEHNFSVNQIAAYLKHLYPDLEMLHINNSVSMPQLKVKTPSKIMEQLSLEKRGFLDEMKDFKNRLAF